MSLCCLFQDEINKYHTLVSKSDICFRHFMNDQIYHLVDVPLSCCKAFCISSWSIDAMNHIGLSRNGMNDGSFIAFCASSDIYSLKLKAWTLSAHFCCWVVRGNSVTLFISFIPGYLPLGVVARSLLDQWSSLIESHLALECIYHFSISDRRQARAVWTKFFYKILYFLHKSIIKHVVYSFVYGCIENLTVSIIIWSEK